MKPFKIIVDINVHNHSEALESMADGGFLGVQRYENECTMILEFEEFDLDYAAEVTKSLTIKKIPFEFECDQSVSIENEIFSI